MKLTRKALRDAVIDAIQDTTDALSVEEEDEIANAVENKLVEDYDEAFEDEEEEGEDEQGG